MRSDAERLADVAAQLQSADGTESAHRCATLDARLTSRGTVWEACSTLLSALLPCTARVAWAAMLTVATVGTEHRSCAPQALDLCWSDASAQARVLAYLTPAP